MSTKSKPHPPPKKVKFAGPGPIIPPIGARVEKINTQPGDTFRDGARGTVVRPPPDQPLKHEDLMGAAFVEWDEIPGIPIFISPNRFRILE